MFLFYFKERFKNLAAIKSTEWDEPKMLLKIVLTYYRENLDEVIILFQLLPVFSYRFPVDVNVSFSFLYVFLLCFILHHTIIYLFMSNYFLN